MFDELCSAGDNINPRQIIQQSIRQNNQLKRALLILVRERNTTLSAIPSSPFIEVRTGSLGCSHESNNTRAQFDPYLLLLKSTHDSILLQNAYLQQLLVVDCIPHN